MLRTALSLFVFGAAAVSANAEVRIVDGDTLEVSGEMMRISGIDAPEAGQKRATKHDSEWPCGREAVEAMAALLQNSEIARDKHEQDRYGRWIATSYADGTDIGETLVLIRHAWAFLCFSDEYEAQQEIASSAELGEWQAPTQTPWDFRE